MGSNPNGPWSYGYAVRYEPALTLFPNSGHPWQGIPAWSPFDNGFCCGMITRNATGGPLVYYGTIVHDPEYLYLETGPFGENTTIRFNAPVAGTYQFKGRFKGLDTVYRGIYVRVRNPYPWGWEIWSNGIPNYGLFTDFNIIRTLEAGQGMDFQLGHDGELYTMGVGLSATVSLLSLTTPSPTPTPIPSPSPTTKPTPSPGPTPSNVTLDGRVLTAGGLGLRNAVVRIANSEGVIATTTTSTLGYYSFENIPAGPSYTITVASKRYRYSPQSVQSTTNLTLPDFVGLE